MALSYFIDKKTEKQSIFIGERITDRGKQGGKKKDQIMDKEKP